MDGSRTREAGIDAFRYLLIALVIFGHSWWYVGALERGNLTWLLLITAHCAVPFFFIASGYFLRWQERDVFSVTRWSCRKLLPPAIIWAAIYLAISWLFGPRTLSDLVRLVTHVDFGRHLWFLPALAFALSAVSVSLRLFGWRANWAMAVILYVIALWHGGYETFAGMLAHPIRGDFLAAPLYVLLGAQLATMNLPRRPLLFGIAVLVGYGLQVIDDTWMSYAPAYTLERQVNVTIATLPYALAVFLFARSLPAGQLIDALARRKRYVMTIYCIHPLFLIAIGTMVHAQGIFIALAVAAVALALSTLAARWWDVVERHRREQTSGQSQLTAVAQH
jgi:surface polysaccharide O-acyltransferase-like enzyme